MKLRIEIEKKNYDVTVEFLEGAQNGNRKAQHADLDIPDSVTRPRAPVKLLEDTFCRSPIAGRVTEVLAVPGQAIRRGDPVLVIEAMKMEIQIGPEVDGVLKSIQVRAGEAVSTGQLLFELT